MSVLKKSLNLVKIISVTRNGFIVVHQRSQSAWAGIEAAPPDPIFGVTSAFRADKDSKKVLLGVGAYRDDAGKPWVLPCVRKAEEMIQSKQYNHEYAVQSGVAEFAKLAAELAFGKDACILQHGLNLTVQSLSGTGALRLAGDFISKFYTHSKVIYVPTPTWAVHNVLFKISGLDLKHYTYYDPKTIGLDFCGMCESIRNMPERAIILFHARAHNPTGIDPSMEQWEEISNLCKERKLFVLFDMAYQGFASGDLDSDAGAVRKFVDDGQQVALCQSFSKNMGLYGERIGACTLIAQSKEEQAKLKSQMNFLIRHMYSNPPLYGARVAMHVMGDPELRCQWLEDIKTMSARIKTARQQLVDGLKKAGSQKDWAHILNQIGMFSFTGLTKEQVLKMTKEHHVYLTMNGRISVASLGSNNVEYVANAMHAVTK
ncbi:unnamed protein product [Ceutorhynchus assimilis]|uniref:Aspartate aminotransferase n=1 Tax=Ceutorhynchus assimilis TaxID=467358 RepID=A0A9N9QRP1_9CUCU|nr:unnamed protein product [Ceutorhynchus assimilis]